MRNYEDSYQEISESYQDTLTQWLRQTHSGHFSFRNKADIQKTHLFPCMVTSGTRGYSDEC